MALLATDYLVVNADPTSTNRWAGQPGGAGTVFVFGATGAAVVFTTRAQAEQVAASINGIAIPANAANTWTPR